MKKINYIIVFLILFLSISLNGLADTTCTYQQSNNNSRGVKITFVDSSANFKYESYGYSSNPGTEFMGLNSGEYKLNEFKNGAIKNLYGNPVVRTDDENGPIRYDLSLNAPSKDNASVIKLSLVSCTSSGNDNSQGSQENNNPQREVMLVCKYEKYDVTLNFYSDKTVEGTTSQTGYRVVTPSQKVDEIPTNCPAKVYFVIDDNEISFSLKNIDGFEVSDYDGVDKDDPYYTGESNEPDGNAKPNKYYKDMDCYGLLGMTSNPEDPAYWLQKGLEIIRYAGIAALVIFSTVDFVQAIISQNNDAISKAMQKTVKRFIYTVLLFFAPILLTFILSFFGVYGTCAL